MPYTVMNSFLDGGYPTGSLNYWKSSFLADLPDTAVIDVMIERFPICPSPMTGVFFETSTAP